jgi:hypothetical protein
MRRARGGPSAPQSRRSSAPSSTSSSPGGAPGDSHRRAGDEPRHLRQEQPHPRGRAAPRREHRPRHRHGLHRRPRARHGRRSDTGKPIMMPVGKECLGRILNVVGEPVDELGPVNAEEALADPPRGAADLRRAVDQGRDLRDGHQGHRPARPLQAGGKIGLFGGAGVGKTVLIMELINNVAKAPRRRVRASPASVSAPARATTSARDERVEARDPASPSSRRPPWSTAR